MANGISEKRRTIDLLLGIFFGWCAAHKYYKGKQNMKKILFTLLAFIALNSTSFAQKATEDFVLVKGGQFQMGYPIYGDDDPDTDEGAFFYPEHPVVVNSFYMCKHEVTQGEYKAIMQKNPSKFAGNDNCPVENVSWFDAVEYCNRRSEREGLNPCYSKNGNSYKCNFSANGYRLPTEAEWEYEARGINKNSTDLDFSGANIPNLYSLYAFPFEEFVWYSSNSENATHEVMKKLPNELGIFDMTGNVWEWCWDWHNENIDFFTYRKKITLQNPTGPAVGKKKVLRGSSYVDDNPSSFEICFHRADPPESEGRYLGFRVVRSDGK